MLEKEMNGFMNLEDDELFYINGGSQSEPYVFIDPPVHRPSETSPRTAPSSK